MHALLGQLAQVRRGCFPRRHDLPRVLVTQLVEGEVDETGNTHTLLEQVRRVHVLQYLQRPQVAFTVRVQCKAGIIDSRANTNGRHGILQDTPCAAVHVYVTRRNERQPETSPFLAQPCQLLALSPVCQQFDRDPETVAKRLAQPVILDIQREVPVGHPEHETARQAVLECMPCQLVAALLCRAACGCDQMAQRCVTLTASSQHDKLAAATQPELGADDEFLQPVLFCRRMCAHDARHRALVGDGERLVAKRRSRLDEFFGVGGAAQEREVTERVQFGVRHGN